MHAGDARQIIKDAFMQKLPENNFLQRLALVWLNRLSLRLGGRWVAGLIPSKRKQLEDSLTSSSAVWFSQKKPNMLS